MAAKLLFNFYFKKLQNEQFYNLLFIKSVPVNN